MDVESVSWRPPPVLRPYLAGATGYRIAGAPPGTHIGLPSPHLTVIIAFDAPMDIAAHADRSQSPATYDVLVGGLHDAPVTIRHDGSQHGIQLMVTPLGSRALLGLPAGPLAMVDEHGSDVLGPAAHRLHEQLSSFGTWDERFACLEAFLLGRLDLSCRLPSELAAAWSLLGSSRGAATVAAVAAEVGWSTRRLNQVFASEVGLSPKSAARVIRFHRARQLLARRVRGGGAADLGRLAAHCGYYDQSHLDRDWRQFAGLAPSAWMRAELVSEAS